jgi:hypothetical protein
MFKIENFLSIALVGLVSVLIFFIPSHKSKKKSSNSKKYYTKSDKEAEMGESNYSYKWKVANIDSVYQLMDDKLDRPTYFYQEFPLLFLLSGRILEDSAVHAIVAKESFNSSFVLEIWKLEEDSSWTKSSDLFLAKLPQTEFDPFLADYNFDGIKDIYLPLTEEAVDHYQVKKGLLCTIDSNYIIKEHPDTKDWGNFQLIDSTETIYSEKINTYENGAKLVCRLNHKWINEELLTSGLACP